jgi:hypothetical protein
LYSPFDRERGGDLKVVIYCIIAAMVFWFFNAMNRDHTANISYPIKFEYKDSSLILVNPLPKKINLHVTGYGWNLLRKTFWFNIEPVVYKLEDPLRTKVITARNLLPVVTEQLNGVKVNYLLKDTFWINFERKTIKEQLVYVDTSKVSLAEGLEIKSPVIVNPPKILVEGPQSLIEKLSDTLFLSIPQNEIDEDYDAEVKIFEVSNLINIDRKKVQVLFKVGKKEPPKVENDSTAIDADSSKGADSSKKDDEKKDD